MKKTLSLILIFALVLSLCITSTAFADDTLTDAEIATLTEIYDFTFSFSKGTDVNNNVFYVCTSGNGDDTYYLDSEFNRWGLAANLAVFQAAYEACTDESLISYNVYPDGFIAEAVYIDASTYDATNRNMFTYKDRDGNDVYYLNCSVNPFTGYRIGDDYKDTAVPCLVFTQVKNSLIPEAPKTSASGGGSGNNDNTSNETNSDGKQQMINYTAKGTESFLVTVPTTYSSSTDTNGKVTMSGEFKIDVTDLAGDGLQYVNLKLSDSSHKDHYFMDTSEGSEDKTHYATNTGSLTEFTDYYLQNEDVATAKIQYAMQKRSAEGVSFNVGDYVICKSVDTMAADYGPFSVTETLDFLLDPNGTTPITNIAHGTYSDLLTFESSVTTSNPQA